MPNLSHGSVWHLYFVYTNKHSGFTLPLVSEIRFVNTITGFEPDLSYGGEWSKTEIF